jgi:DNA invertase Pin-like site-specific DNA recombinase
MFLVVLLVKENFQLTEDDIQGKMMRTLLALFSEIEHDLIVARTEEGLEAALSMG